MKLKKLKNIGIAAVLAIAATTALGAGSASAATGFVAETYPPVVKGDPTGEFVFTVGGINVYCSGLGFSGAEPMPPITELEPSSVSDATCTNSGSVAMNGCKLEFAPEEEKSGYFNGEFRIGPEGCGAMVLKYKYFSNTCEKSFAPQTATAGFANEGSGSSATVNIWVATSLTYTEIGKCSKTGTSGTLSGSWDVSATDATKAANGLAVANELPIGVYETEGAFEAEAYPADLIGNQTDPHTLILGTGSNIQTIVCEDVVYSDQLSKAAGTLSVEAEFVDCKGKISIFTFPVEVEMNACGLALAHAAGVLEIACVGEDTVEVETFQSKAKQEAGEPLCVASIDSQEVPAGFDTNEALGTWRSILVDFETTSLAYSLSGSGLCGSNGSHTNGSYTGGSELLGYFD
jgi:hypothetical protein